MKLFLIRHGVAATGGRMAGHADYPLSEEGQRQAVALAQHLHQHQSITRLITSPLKRASATAAAIASETGLRAEVWPELMERSGGLFNGRTLEEAREQFSELFEHAWSNPLIAPPFGESYLDVSLRIGRVIEHIVGLDDDEVVAIVAHNGCLNIFLHTLLGLDPDSFPLFKWEPTGVTAVSITQDRKATLLYLNRVDHLLSSKEDLAKR